MISVNRVVMNRKDKDTSQAVVCVNNGSVFKCKITLLISSIFTESEFHLSHVYAVITIQTL